MEIKIVTVESGDWACLYKDGVDFYQGHSIEYDDVLSAIGEGGTLDYWNGYIVTDEYVQEVMSGNLPNNFDEIPEDAFMEW